MTQPPHPEPEERVSDWQLAQDRATMLRLDRTEPPAARRRVARGLGPVLVALWVVSVGAHLLAHIQPGAHRTLEVTGDSAALALIILGVVWLYFSGLVNFAGTTATPWAALSKADRRQVRRQLARREPLDFEHADITLELAHRQRRFTLGYLALVAIELPNSIGIALGDLDPVVLITSCVSLAIFGAIGVYAVVVSARLAALIRQLTEASASA